MRSPSSASATSSAQPLRRQQQRLDVALGAAIDQRRPAGELAEFGQELPRPLLDQRRDMTEPVALGDGDMALQHDEHARSGLAGLEQQLAMRIGADFAEMLHARDFGCCQRRKGLLGAREARHHRVSITVFRFVLPHCRSHSFQEN